MMRMFLLFSILLICAFTPLTAQNVGDTLVVAIKEAPMRQSPNALDKTILKLKYEDRVTVVKVQKDWYFCKAKSQQEGWVHKSAIVPQNSSLLKSSGKNASTTSSSGASNKEVALAGKGFNAAVEAEYGRTNKLSYKAVDEIERQGQSLESLIKFIEQGGTQP